MNIQKKTLCVFVSAICFLLFSCDTSPQQQGDGDQPVPFLPDADPNAAYIYTANFAAGIAPRFTPTAENVKLNVVDKNGAKVLRVSGRTAWWEQLAFDLTGIVTVGKSYLFSVEILHTGVNQTDCTMDYHDAENILYNGTDNNADIRSYSALPNTWTKLEGIIVVEACKNPYLNFRQVGESDFYIHNFKIAEITVGMNDTAEPFKTLASARQIPFFGTIAGFETFNSIYNENFTSFVNKHFNFLSCGTGQFQDGYKSMIAAREANAEVMPICVFTDTDKIYDYAQAHGMKIRGHAIIYGSTQWDWFFHERYDTAKPYVNTEILKTRLEYLVKTVVQHYDTKYPGITYSWDIFNEVIDVEHSDDDKGIRNNDKLYAILGNDYIKLVYSYARKYLNPSYNTKLFLNDWGCHTNKRARLIALANWMNDGNALIPGVEGAALVDGIGMEGYYNVSDTDLIDITNTDYGIAEAVKQFNAHNLEVQFTELTVANSDDTEVGRNALAKYDYDLYTLLITLNKSQRAAGKKGITGICTWGIIDNPFLQVNDYATGLTGTHCGMLDYTFKAKPGFYAIQAALKEKAYPY